MSASLMDDTKRVRIAALLLAAITIFPFLSRFHFLPLPQWWGEITVVCCAALAGLLLPGTPSAWPRASIWMMVLALVWALQPWFLPVLFPGLNQATALAFVALSVLALVVIRLRLRWGAEALITYLCKAILIGTLLQSLIGLAQVTGLAQVMGGVLFYDSSHPTTNVFGHIGQRNQYAHYLTWGVIAAAWLLVSGQPARRWLWGAIAWLSLSIAFAGSRTVLLYAFALAIMAGWWHWRLRVSQSAKMMRVMWLAVALIVAMQFALPLAEKLLAPLLHGPVAASGLERLAANSDGMGARRLAEWGKAWIVFTEHPGYGFGWYQYASESVRLQMLPQFANAGVNSGLFANAHNLVFQLLAEMGLVGTLCAVLGFTWAAWPYFGRRVEPVHLVPLAIMAVTLIHSMLEYPLWYLYFPAVMVMMLALAPEADEAPIVWLTPLYTVLAIALLVLAAYGSWRYREMQGLYYPTTQRQQQRLEQIIRHEPMFASHALGLLDDVITPTPQALKTQRHWLELMAAFRPYPDVLRRKAQMEALAGEQEKAAHTFSLALASFPTYAPDFLAELDEGEPAWARLRAMAQAATDKLPPQYR
ncbi:PglL family O-oligosaccharyltransferase [Vogesella sp. XCS3]|uniref:PglL family O-oligosaccharyltransferase n=1 Tax=Vogesella sp. XCS3 TaxID=2877939 RepID=UPI001D0B3DD7|nr:O-antigen ligase family protein [Vogesella sp. XCS3]UDM15808.1 Wzy polymerase domain-containing protein [Vogesella sp. XCS3]